MNSQKETDNDVEDRLLEVQASSNLPTITNNHENLLDKDSLRTEVVQLNSNENNLKVDGPILVNARNEDDYSRKQRKKSHLVIYATTFIMSIGFSIVITGVWPYLQKLDPSSSKQFLGWAIAVNPLGQMIASPLLGWYGFKRGSNRRSFVITIIMFICGNILYALLPLFKQSSKYVMLVSRFITGISSANIAVCRSYISSSTIQKERTMALSITAASQSMGFILGPSIQTAITYIHPFESPARNPDSNSSFVDDCLTSSFNDKNSHLDLFNMYSLAGWFTAALGFLNFILYLPCVYKEFNIASSEEIKGTVVESDTKIRVKTDYIAIVFLLLSYFFILLIYVIVETLIVPMCLDLYAWSSEFAVKVVGIGLTVIGVIAFCMFILAGRLSRIFNDRKVFIICGLVPLALSLLIFLPMHGDTPKINYFNSTVAHNDDYEDLQDSNVTARFRRSAVSSNEFGCESYGCPYTQEWCFYTPIIHISQLIVASCVMTVGYPVSVSLAGAIFSKMLHSKDQGLWMGLLTSAGSFSRFVGPIFVSYLYTAKGPLWTFGTLFTLLLLVLIQNIIFYKRLAPLDTLNISTSNIT